MAASAQRNLTLAAPVGGEKWSEPTQNVTWMRDGTGWDGAERVCIEFSRDSGANRIVETDTFPGDGSSLKAT